MAKASVGKIKLDLSVNDKGFKKQIDEIKGMAKGAGAVIAAAFGIHELVDFGKECLELGSDLAEVQNVVDVTFPNMTKEIDAFAKSAATSFGLSETMAKKFVGTFGSMAEAFGFSEKQAAKMATELTGLSGDVASFYNISQDEAYTKLKSVFTGETESLKDLGVVMTQTALEEFAMNQGLGDSIAKMSEAQKVSLRYAFVQDKLANASGDFARTSGSWANQTRILSLQFDSLKASLGQGLINVFTPVIRQINALMAKLVELSGLFKNFTEMLMGKSSSDAVDNTAKAAAAAKKELAGAAGEADALAASTEKSGKAAKDAAKEMLGLMGFDELNNASSGKDDSKGGAASMDGLGASDFKPAEEESKVLDGLRKKLQAIKERFDELAGLFKKGFKIGLGNTDKVFKNIRKEIKSIKKSLKKIFSDKDLQKAASDFADTFAESLGRVAGSVASIGLSIGDFLLGSLSTYLEEHADDLTEDITELFNVSSEISELIADAAECLATLFEIFRTSEAKQIGADILNIFTDGFTNVTVLVAKVARDLLNVITKPFTENQDAIKDALVKTLKPLSRMTKSLSDTWSDMWDAIQDGYDEHVKPLMDSLADGFSDIVVTILDVWDETVLPALDEIADAFESLMEEHIQPAIHKVVDAVGALSDALKAVWKDWIVPFAEWFLEKCGPPIIKAIKDGVKIALDAFAGIADAFGGLADAFSGLCDTIKAISKGDWKAAWAGIKKTAEGLKDAVAGLVRPIVNVFKDLGKKIKEEWSKSWKDTKAVFSSVKEWFSAKFSGAYKAVKSAFSGIGKWFESQWKNVKDAFKLTNEFFRDKFVAAYTSVTKSFSGIKKYFSDIWSDIKATFANVADWFGDKFSKAWQKVKAVFSSGGEIFSGIKEGIDNTFKAVVNKLISGINLIIKKPFDKINEMLNDIRSVSVAGIKPFSKLWKKDPLAVPSIPALAQGGFVKANTPQLAMIGDNRKYGEVVAPENKMQEMVDAAVAKAQGNTVNALVPVIERLCNAIIELEESGGKSGPSVEKYKEGDLLRVVRNENEKYKRRNGGKSAIK